MIQFRRIYLLFCMIYICNNIDVNCQELNENISAISVIGNYHEIDSFIVNKTTEYIVWYRTRASIFPTRLSSITTGASSEFPIMVVIRQQKDVTSWKLPLLVRSYQTGSFPFLSASKTLCHTYMNEITTLNRSMIDYLSNMNNTELLQEFSISVSTASSKNLNITITTQDVTDFYVKENKDYSIVISPSEPRYYYYKFYERNTENFSDTVVLEVESADDTCFYVSIQDPKCPVDDFEQDIHNARLYQTVTTKGGLTIGNFEFPNGFFVVFVAKGDNYECSLENSLISSSYQYKMLNQTSAVNFKVRSSISIEDYIKASLTVLALIFGFYIIFLIILYTFYIVNKKRRKNSTTSHVNDSYFLNLQSPMMRALELDISREDIDSRLHLSTIYLSDLAKGTHEYYNKKSLNYCWQVVIIAIFYSIPVVQLVITYQRILNFSGNQDLCYFNFLCANPLFGLSDFNHIFSNVPYVFVGILFLLIVLLKDKWEINKPNYGIPKHYGLYYAMGVSLIIEGILSACYHICPNQANFQFDTSFMYVLAVLCMIKIYQKRHPDINAVAYATFLVLGIAIFIATIGIIDGSLLIWIFFIITYIIFSLYLSFNTYFLSYVKQGLMTIFKECKAPGGALLDVFKPRRRAHFIICCLGNLINSTMALMGIYCYINGIDFGTFLLVILMGNAFLYCVCYTCMKLSNGEKICAQAICFAVLSLLTWSFSGYFFVNANTLWYVSPAESRQRNTKCNFLNFYDNHDIWHLLSAPALFFTFMFLMVIDDDIKNKPHFEIPVF